MYHTFIVLCYFCYFEFKKSLQKIQVSYILIGNKHGLSPVKDIHGISHDKNNGGAPYFFQPRACTIKNITNL